MGSLDRRPHARFLDLVENAARQLGYEFPETAPVVIDRSRMVAGFASGEMVELEAMAQEDRRRPGTIDEAAVLAHLRAARLAGLELAEFSVASWSACGPRVGLLLRPWHPDSVGVALSARWSLSVFIGSRYGLVPVFSHHLAPWRRSPAEVTRRAIANGLAETVRCHPVPSSDPSVRVWLLAGGSFVASHLLDIEAVIGCIGGSTVLAGLYADRALLVARSDRPRASASAVATALTGAISHLDTAMSGTYHDVWFGVDRARGVMVQCRSDRWLAVLEPRFRADEEHLDESGHGHEPDGSFRW